MDKIKYIESDLDLVNKYREKHNLKKPNDFEKGRIDPEILEKLMPVIQIALDDNEAGKEHNNIFNINDKPISLLEFRIQEVFGITHIRIKHAVGEKGYEEIKDGTKANRKYYCKCYVTLEIGNWTLYTDTNGIPDAKFLPYFSSEGIGFGEGDNEGIAEKKALEDGKREIFKNIGMFRFWSEKEPYEKEPNDKDEEPNYTEKDSSTLHGDRTTITLINSPAITPNGAIFLKGKAIDNNTGNEITVVIYKENKYNEQAHRNMVQMLNNNKSLLVKDKELNIIYKETTYNEEKQYVINAILKNKDEI